MKVLIIDNNQNDRKRIKQVLQKGFYGLEFFEIINREDFDEVIARGDFDVVLTDYILNWADGLWILRMVKKQFPHKPVIMITNTGTEDIAVKGMKSGLSDYVLKRNLRYLPAAIKKSLENAKLLNEQSKVSGTWHGVVSSYSYEIRVESKDTFVCECVTETFKYITGYTLEEVNAPGSWFRLIHPDDIPIFMKHCDCLLSGQPNVSEFRIIARSSEILWLRDYAQPVWDKTQDRVVRIYGFSQNITEQKWYEDTIREPEAIYYKSMKTVKDNFHLCPIR